LSGLVIHASDVQTIPDEPYSEGHLLVVRDGDWAPLVEAVSPGREAGQALVGIVLEEPHYSRFVFASTPLGPDGRFGFDLPAGGYRLCVGNVGEKRPAPPVFVYGCTAVEVTDGDSARVRVTFGEGGLQYYFNQ